MAYPDLKGAILSTMIEAHNTPARFIATLSLKNVIMKTRGALVNGLPRIS